MSKRNLVAGLILGLVLMLVTAAWPGSAASAEVVKIGVFDLQRAVNDCKKGKAAKAKIIKKFEKLQTELKIREAELNKLQQELERQAAMLSLEAKLQKEKTLKRKVRDFQDQYRDYTEEMRKAEVQATQPIVNDLLRIANEFGREKGYTLVLEGKTAGVIYAPKAVDITAEVVKRYDAAK